MFKKQSVLKDAENQVLQRCMDPFENRSRESLISEIKDLRHKLEVQDTLVKAQSVIGEACAFIKQVTVIIYYNIYT